MKTSKFKLTIIVLSFNTKDLLQQTLDSLTLQPDWQLIVVDNGSTDGSPEMIEAKYPQAQLIKNSQNLGFAAGNNLGLKRSHSQYVMLLNSDTIIKDDAISKLIAYMDAHPNVAAITPKVILEDGAIDLACHRGMPTPWNAFTYFSKLESLFPNTKIFTGYHQTYQDFNTTHQIDATAATALMVRRSVIDEIGLLDERFFLYAEDLDWCKRMTDAGYQIIYYPQAIVLHFKSRSGKKRDTKEPKHHQVKIDSHAHFYDTMKQFYQKHYHHKYPKWLQKLVFAGIDLKKKLSRK